MRAFGRRGGSGATARRAAESLIDPVSGLTKRVFFGQRWLCVVQQHETALAASPPYGRPDVHSVIAGVVG